MFIAWLLVSFKYKVSYFSLFYMGIFLITKATLKITRRLDG